MVVSHTTYGYLPPVSVVSGGMGFATDYAILLTLIQSGIDGEKNQGGGGGVGSGYGFGQITIPLYS